MTLRGTSGPRWSPSTTRTTSGVFPRLKNKTLLLLTSRYQGLVRADYTLASILRETDGSQQLVTLPQVGKIWTKTWELKFGLKGKSSGVEVAEGAAAVAAAGQAGDGGAQEIPEEGLGGEEKSDDGGGTREDYS